MYLRQLLKIKKKIYKEIPIKGISFDSRKVKKGDVFFSIAGYKKSSSEYVNEAILKGASVIISNKKIKYPNFKIPYIFDRDARESLAEACSNFYKAKPKNIIAVTGTNGKSSVADFFYQILNNNKMSVASIGTLGIISKNYKKKISLTSPDPLLLHQSLHILAKNKVNNVILEASSHGLKQKRLNYLNIKCGIFTNLSHDHLDYHKNMESYFKSKMYLFRNLLKPYSNIITDEENKEFKKIKSIPRMKKITIGLKSGDVKILENSYEGNNQIIKLLIKKKTHMIKVLLIGFFQVKNLLMAILAASTVGLNKIKILNQIQKIKPVEGRLECVKSLKNKSKVIVDFAHTPEALQKSLIALRNQFNKKIILVFGCGGERDKKKRFQMGLIAKNYCRKVFVTDDNPRNENPYHIRKSIMRGCGNIAISIQSRKKAIETAIKELKPNEILLVAGKGHETTQNYGNKIVNFSDKKIIKEFIKKNQSIFKTNWSKKISKKVFMDNNLNGFNYSGASINTRTIKKNNLFFAIKGKNIDGHKFVKEAINKGAAKCVVSKKIKLLSKNKTLKVKNTFLCLNRLAKITRDNFSGRVIGVTGSVGKTTLKNLIGFSLKNYGNVYHSPFSYNNKFGVPLSVSNLSSNNDYGVFEIGMDKKGEINKLSKIVKPHVAIITNISEAHFKNFATLKDIAKAKSEIIVNISKGGSIVLNKDCKFFSFFSKKAKKNSINIISFSNKKKANIFLLNIKKIKNYYRLKVNIKNKVFYFDTAVSTESIVNNILACISILHALNLNLKFQKDIFKNFLIPDGRGDIRVVKKFKKSFRFIDESYNANPMSMASAIKNMQYYKRKKNTKKLVFLGDMLQLGKKSQKLHRSLSNIINRSDIDKVFVYGKDIKTTFNLLSPSKKGKVFSSLTDAYYHFGKILHNNDLLMVKGSNATGLNKFSKNIKKGQFSAI